MKKAEFVLKKGILWGALCLFSMSLAACGSGKKDSGNPVASAGEEQTDAKEDEFGYLTEWKQLDLSYKGDSFISYCVLDEQNVYYAMTASENQSSHAYVASVDFLTGGEPEVIEQGEGWIAGLFMDPQGNPWCVRTVPETRDKPVEWYLEKVGLQGENAASFDISEYMKDASNVSDGGIDENGNCYLLAGEWGAFDLKIFNPAGECIRTVEDIGDVTYLDIWEGKGVLLYGYSGNAQLFTMQTQFPEPIQEISNNGDLKLAAQKDGNIFFVNNSNLMCYDANTKESVKVLNITDINTMTDYVQDVCVLEDGRLALLIRDWNANNQLEVVCLKKVPKSEIPEKQIIRLGTLYAMAGSDLEAAIVNFNKTSSEYKIEVVDYYTSDWVTGIQKLNQELAAGNAPDLIDLRLIEENLYSCLEKGVLEDLVPYLDASDKVSREDFLPNLLDAYTQYHILYAIPADFQIKTVIGKSSELGDASGWSPEEVMEYASGLPEDVNLLQYESPYLVLEYLLNSYVRQCINTESAEMYFDEEQLSALLEFARRYSDRTEGISYEQIPQNLHEGKLRLYQTFMVKMADLQDYYKYFDGQINFIGYPAASGECGSYFAKSGATFGINSKSEYKDEAWKFLESQLTRETQLSKAQMAAGTGFPSRKDALEAYFDRAMEIEYEYDENGEIRTDENGEPVEEPIFVSYTTGEDGNTIKEYYYASRQEEVDMVKALIDSMTQNDMVNREVLNIIQEEAAAYFSDQKSLVDVVDIIQNRLKLYISERQ